MNMITIREDGLLAICRTMKTGQSTEKYSDSEQNPEPETIIDFNELYRGYYPSCRFTDAAFVRDMYYAAGTDEEGMPHLFESLLGNVWTETRITDKKGLFPIEAYGDIVRILYSRMEQMFLVTEKGLLIVLPDCPDCIRVRRITEKRIIRAFIEEQSEDETLIIETDDGSTARFSLYSFYEYRASKRFAVEKLRQGGLLINLKNEEDELEAERKLETLPRDTNLFYICETGVRADELAREARTRGFRNSWSLGSIRDFT